MSDMMKMFVEQELQNQIKENYPHMQYPPGLYAKVKTDIPVLKNEIVAIVLMYGERKPYIIGRCF